MSILEEAETLINGDRAIDYGPVTENFLRIRELWTAYLDGDDVNTLYDVANMMILVKLARVKNAGYHRDSYTDIAGYAALAERVNDELSDDEPQEIDDVMQSFYDAFYKGLTTPWKRSWDLAQDVPPGVVVADKDGDFWKWEDGKRYYKFRGVEHWTKGTVPVSGDSEWLDKYAPFTEVVS